ncbi:MAG TPA: hypothetical protein VJW76_03610 [Verrucomicrobiae bacterium]|nr:hypothetical protein [Verrucomicrobiae bacterium]
MGELLTGNRQLSFDGIEHVANLRAQRPLCPANFFRRLPMNKLPPLEEEMADCRADSVLLVAGNTWENRTPGEP